MNINTVSRRSVLPAVAFASLFGLKAASAQPIQPIQQADPISPDGVFSLLRQDRSAMFSNARLNMAAFGDTGFGDTFIVNLQVRPTTEELQEFLATGASHVAWLVNITNVEVTDMDWGNGDRLRSAGGEVWVDEGGSSFWLHCLNIIKPNPEDGLRWEADEIASMSTTLNGRVMREGSITISLFLIPGIYRLEEPGELVYSRDTNGNMLDYYFTPIGEPARVTDSSENTEFEIARR